MVGLILLGAVSGALFARSACADIGPSAVTLPVTVTGTAAGPPVPEQLATLLPDAAATELAALDRGLAVLADHLGVVTGFALASGAQELTATTLGPVAVGSEVVQLAASGAPARTAVSLGSGTAVGSGAHLYSLALTNALTGQVDALQPLDAELGGLTCVDTALVGSPLAFHLDAGGGQLLLLRIDEDGDDPELELRDPVAGRVWGADLTLPTAPAGLAGARLTAGLGPELIVAGTRTGPGEPAPVLTAVARDDGTPRWSLDRDDLAAIGIELSSSAATRAEVIAVDDELVLVALREVTGEGRADEEAEQDARSVGAQQVIALGVAAGELRWSLPLAPGERVVSAVRSGEAVTVVSLDAGTVPGADTDGTIGTDGRDGSVGSAPGAQVRVRRVSGDGAEVGASTAVLGPQVSPAAIAGAVGSGPVAGVGSVAGSAVLADGRVVVVTGAGVEVWGAGPSAVVDVEVELTALDVVAHRGGTTLLLRVGPSSVAVTFAEGS